MLLLAGAVTLGCAMGDAPAEAPGAAAPGSKLRTSGFEGGCFDRPEADFTPSNHAEVEAFAKAGEPAWEFTLPSLDGGEVTLSDLLQTKPVVILTGSYSCPVYRKNQGKIEKLADRLGDRVHVVIVYGPEAHPKNDNSPYSGDNWAKPDKYSHVDLARTDAERMKNARKVGGASGVIELVEPVDNPFWCTYGTAANAGYLIAQDGTFYAVHDWFDPPTMIESISALFDREPPQKGRGAKKRRRRQR